MFPNSSEQKFSLKLFSSKELLNKNIKGKESTNKIQKIHAHKSNKQLAILAKFRYSLNVQLEKAKKSIENMSFKNSEHCTFEDFRDNQMNDNSKGNKKSPFKIKKFENVKESDKKIKKHKSSKYNNLFFHNVTIDPKNKEMSNSSKKSVSNKNVNEIVENDFEDIIEDDEQKAALERLNRAYERFGKENLNLLNEI
jgi:hypothetical protein